MSRGRRALTRKEQRQRKKTRRKLKKLERNKRARSRQVKRRLEAKKIQNEKVSFKRRKLNKKKVLQFILFIILIFVLILFIQIYIKYYLSYKKMKETSEQKIQIQEEVKSVEDENVKALIQDVIAKKELSEDNFAFFYYNTNSKKYYLYNESKYMIAASSIKMPLAMMYYDQVVEGKITLTDKLTYTKESYEEGLGSTTSMYKVQEQIPINYLIEQSIVNSDNTATNILINNMGYKEYRNGIAKYSTIELPPEFYTENITSAKYGFDVCMHLYENIEKYAGLIDLLKKSSEGSYLKKYINDAEVAHKYGSYEGYMHDSGIVFGKEIYLIGIYTKSLKEDSEEFIANLSKQVYELVENSN